MQDQSPIIRFLSGDGTDHQRRTVDTIRGWNDDRLEAVHDYIQWLFPLAEGSGFNPYAPILVREDVVAIRESPTLRSQMRRSFARMLAFYGFTQKAPGEPIAGPDPERSRRWVTPGNHNFLRISRILRSLNLLGLEPDAAAFHAVLERLAAGEAGRIIGTVPLHHWREAARASW